MNASMNAERFSGSRAGIKLGAAVLAGVILAAATIVVVPEGQQALILRFGEPVSVINRYRQDQQFGGVGAGIGWRVPFVDEVVRIDKRVLEVSMERQQVLSTDQLRLNIDGFALFRIVDPLRMRQTAGTETNVATALGPLLGSALRNELGKRPFVALLSPERDNVMHNIRVRLNQDARAYGALVLDVRIKQADLPEGAPLESAYARMRTAREQEALSIRAQGAKRAQIIRADADAKAAGIYAQAFSKDAEFYDFFRAMQSYRKTFSASGEGQAKATEMILSPNNDYLRAFRTGR